MKVKIWELATESEVDALIRVGKESEMPSMHENWRFNFHKHMKQANCIGYVLTCADTPMVIEGCMILKMKADSVLYLSYLEVAPQNQKTYKKYDWVAGCLIAFAYKQSFLKAEDDYRGMLFIGVSEADESDQRKLMGLYSEKYNAKKYSDTIMAIVDEDGDELIKKYLDNE